MRFKFLQVHFSANTWFRTFTPGLTKVRQLLIPLSGEVYKLYINPILNSWRAIPLSGEVYKLYINPILNSWRAYSELIPHKTLRRGENVLSMNSQYKSKKTK